MGINLAGVNWMHWGRIAKFAGAISFAAGVVLVAVKHPWYSAPLALGAAAYFVGAKLVSL